MRYILSPQFLGVKLSGDHYWASFGVLTSKEMTASE
jgi:hypothetical protein